MWISLIGLRLDRLDHLGVAMAGRADRDAGREVEEAVAVDIGDDVALTGLGDERVGAGQAGADDRVVACDEGLGARPRQLGDDMRRRQAGSRGGGAGLEGHRYQNSDRSGASCPRPWLDGPLLYQPIWAGPHRFRRFADQPRPRVDEAGPQLDQVGAGRNQGRGVLAGADAARGDDRQPMPDDGPDAANEATGPGQQRRAGEAAGLRGELAGRLPGDPARWSCWRGSAPWPACASTASMTASISPGSMSGASLTKIGRAGPSFWPASARASSSAPQLLR